MNLNSIPSCSPHHISVDVCYHSGCVVDLTALQPIRPPNGRLPCVLFVMFSLYLYGSDWIRCHRTAYQWRSEPYLDARPLPEYSERTPHQPKILQGSELPAPFSPLIILDKRHECKPTPLYPDPMSTAVAVSVKWEIAEREQRS